MTDLLNEITFCDECPYSGEPNGCNRKEGICKAYESYFDLVEENAILRERLEKAIELPCKIGDTVYKVYDKCDGNNCPYNGYYGQWRCHYEGEQRCKPFIIIKQFCYSDIPFVNKTIFVLREAAEARLAEILKMENDNEQA